MTRTVKFLFALCISCYLSSGNVIAQITLYDNLHLFPGAPGAPFGPQFDSRSESFAQQFFTGQTDNVSSVTLSLQRKGTPTGNISIQLWDDNGSGVPGNMIDTIGLIDLSSLSAAPVQMSLDGTISDLNSNGSYFVVLDNSETTVSGANSYRVGLIDRRKEDTQTWLGTLSPEPGKVLVTGLVARDWLEIENSRVLGCHPNFGCPSYMQMQVTSTDSLEVLQAGDANQDLNFDQLDLAQVQVAAKYLTGESATWGEGDWDGTQGGSPGSPPTGDGVFDQFDIIAAQQAGSYLTGPYAAIQANGAMGDGQTSVIYNSGTGEMAVDAPAGVELTSINIDSASGKFTGDTAANLGGSFDNDADSNIFKATFGGSFGSVSFGNVAQSGLSEEFLLGDLTAVGSLADGRDLGSVDLVYVPEPATIGLFLFGLLIGLPRFRHTKN